MVANTGREARDMVDEEAWDEEDEDTQKDKFLTFRLGNEDYGIEIKYVTEIVGIQNITEVPDMPAFVKGVINLRGQVIPVMDVRLRFRMPARDYDDRTCVIVVIIEGTAVGLVVDTVQEVREIPAENVSAAPQVGKGTATKYILGLGKVGEEVKILLDVNKLLFDKEMAVLQSVAAE